MSELYPLLEPRRPGVLSRVMTKVLSTLLALLVLLYVPLLALGNTLLQALVLTYLWGWFVVPTFHLPPLSFPLAIGLRLTLGFLTPIRLPSGGSDRDKGEAKEGDKPLRKGAPVWSLLWVHLLLLVVPLLWLAFGWVVHFYL